METPISTEAFVWGLGTLCGLNRIPFDARLVASRFPPPYNIASFQQATIEFGFKVSQQHISIQDIHPAAFPAFALLKPVQQKLTETNTAVNDQAPSADVPQPELLEAGLAFILKADQSRVLWSAANDPEPKTTSFAEFDTLYAGQVIFALKQTAAIDEEGLAEIPTPQTTPQPQTKFGFKWFIPELLKHKKIWREILYASFAMQLVALATPLCTQVIIDKVVVHHTTSTLIVIAVALGIFLIFNAAMGWVRQYLVLHTDNRMDAVLGHKVLSPRRADSFTVRRMKNIHI